MADEKQEETLTDIQIQAKQEREHFERFMQVWASRLRDTAARPGWRRMFRGAEGGK